MAARIVNGIPKRQSSTSKWAYLKELLNKLSPDQHIREENVDISDIHKMTGYAYRYGRMYLGKRTSYTTLKENGPGTRTVLIWWREEKESESKNSISDACPT